VDIDSAGFAEFYETARDDCLRAVFASVGDLRSGSGVGQRHDDGQGAGDERGRDPGR
jgi:hypothetical protein